MRKIFKITFAFTLLFAFVSCSGDEGPMGEPGSNGIDGSDGNANVKKYSITINKDDWEGAHFGGNNVHNYYKITESMTGNISIASPDHVALAYARPKGLDYAEKKPLPYVFGVEDNYGIKLELGTSRSEVWMSKTTKGWDNNEVPLNQMPDEVQLDIILIEVGAVNALETQLDFNNYEEVAEYFNLN